MESPLAIDLFCGLGGWTDGLLAEGYYVVGFDTDQHIYGKYRYPGQLVIQDVTTLHGSQFKDAALIVASPPCQEYSYMAMPWSLAKAKAAEYRSGKRDVKHLTALFYACFRIQREACEAAGRHIPLIVENVKGAQPWIGRARWNFGSFYLWGDVPALMPTARTFKSSGMNWSDRSKHGQDFTRLAGEYRIKVASLDGGCRAAIGKGARFTSRDCSEEGIKQRGSGREWLAGDGKISRMTSSKSPSRKFASAMIAKIPLPLSRHIAKTFRPDL